MSRRRGDVQQDRVEPDLPITPMLDMAFQLLAFFVMTFNPSPSEKHLDMALPKIEGGESTAPPPTTIEEDADEITVSIEAADNGDIAQIRLGFKGDAGEDRKLGTDTGVLVKTLKERLTEKKKAGKVKLQIADKLAYKLVVKVMDELHRAGYKQVAPALLVPGGKK